MSIDPVSAGATVLKYGLAKLYKVARKKRIKRLSKSVNKNDVLVVLELGREIKQDVEAQLGDIDYLISYVETIKVEDFEKIAAEAVIAIQSVNRLESGKRIVCVLSGPHGIIAPFAQAIGLDHYNIVWATFQHGKYVIHPSFNRSLFR